MKSAALCALLAATVAQAASPRIGAKAPDFTLRNSADVSRRLSDFKGRIVFINFWASWCDPCKEELPLLDQFAAAVKKDGVVVLAVNIDEKRVKADALLVKLKLIAPALEILWDPKSAAVSSYDPTTMPSSYILDAAGVVRFAHAGYHDGDPARWRDEINALRSKPHEK